MRGQEASWQEWGCGESGGCKWSGPGIRPTEPQGYVVSPPAPAPAAGALEQQACVLELHRQLKAVEHMCSALGRTISASSVKTCLTSSARCGPSPTATAPWGPGGTAVSGQASGAYTAPQCVVAMADKLWGLDG